MIYVDNLLMPAKIGNIRSRWSHLIAFPKNDAELIAFGQSIGLKASWLQRYGYTGTHFDVTESMREKAIHAGAVEVSVRGLVNLLFAD